MPKPVLGGAISLEEAFCGCLNSNSGVLQDHDTAMAGIDSATQKRVETDQKLVNSEFRYGIPFQPQPLLDCLDQMSAKVDQRHHHSLSRFGAADLMASVDVDVE